MHGPRPQPQSLTGRILRALALYVLAPLLLLLEIPVAVHVAQKPSFGFVVHQLEIRDIRPGGPADRAGLNAGDRLLAVDGVPVGTMVDWYVAHAGRYELGARTYLVRRDGRFITAEVVPTRPDPSSVIWHYGLSLAGLAFLAMGWLVLARRHDMVSRYFFGLCSLFAFFLMDVPDWPSPVYMTVKDIVRDFAQLALPVAFLRFFLYFPDRTHLTSDNHRRHRLLWLPAALLLGVSLVIQALRLDPASAAVTLATQATGLFLLVYFASGLVVFARKVIRRDRPVAHSKLRIVLVGLLAGFVPFLIGAILHIVGPEPAPWWQHWLVFSLVLVPVSFGLAILRYGALDLEDLVRHGLVYGALTVTVVLSYALLVGVLGHAMAVYFRTTSTPVILAAAMGTALLLNPARRRLHTWVDHTVYPARRATRKALHDLGHELSGLIENSDAPTTMLMRLFELYRPQHVALFLEREGFLVLHAIECAGDATPKPIRFEPGATLPRILMTSRRPVAVEEFEGLDTERETDAATRAAVDALDIRLVVPLITGNRLVGFLTFGPKTSGALYTQADTANLHDFSMHAAALVEIGRLYQDSLKRERIDTELAVAQRIQQSLVPERPLETPGARLVGRMVSCREVGGDSFDYFLRDRDTVGFAIADAAGKGVPAALIMTSLRAAFRSAALTYDEPERVVEELNTAVSELATPGQFVCFFYATYHQPTRTLRYCNAGMNPPLLFREGRNWAEKMKKGGLVLGIDGERRYAHGTLHLEPGDLLVLYTDGITEQTDAEGRFFGEDRLEAAIHTARDLPPDTLLDRIFATVEAFGGPNQSDDRTLMLLRTNTLPPMGAVQAR